MPLWQCIVRGQGLGQGRSRERPVASRDTLPKSRRSRAPAPCHHRGEELPLAQGICLLPGVAKRLSSHLWTDPGASAPRPFCFCDSLYQSCSYQCGRVPPPQKFLSGGEQEATSCLFSHPSSNVTQSPSPLPGQQPQVYLQGVVQPAKTASELTRENGAIWKRVLSTCLVACRQVPVPLMSHLVTLMG